MMHVMIFLVCMFSIAIFSGYMLIRNQQVFNERMKVHKAIFRRDKNGFVHSYKEINDLIKEIDSIATYDQMMHRFWKRPSSFYKEFLEKIK